MVYACFILKNGKTMHSFCKEHNLSYSVAVSCIECGMSPDEAVEKAIKVKGKRGHNNLKYRNRCKRHKNFFYNKIYHL